MNYSRGEGGRRVYIPTNVESKPTPLHTVYVTLSVKTQLKSFLFVIYCFLHKLISHKVKDILWKFYLHSFKIDWVRSCQRLKL